MRQTVAVPGIFAENDEPRKEAIEAWTNGDALTLTYQSITIAVPLEPVEKLVKAVRRGKKHSE